MHFGELLLVFVDRTAHFGDCLALLAKALHCLALHGGAPAILLCGVFLVGADVLGDLLCKRLNLLCKGLRVG